MKYLKLFENIDIDNCTWNGVNYKIGDMISIYIDKIKDYVPMPLKFGRNGMTSPQSQISLTSDAQYEIIEILNRKTGSVGGRYNGPHYDIAIFNDNNDYVQIPIECVYKELESAMVKYNL